jgi:ATP-dependent RNA helicase DeaD
VDPKAPDGAVTRRRAEGAGAQPEAEGAATRRQADGADVHREADGAGANREAERKSKGKAGPLAKGMERFRLEVGKAHGVKPATIVAALVAEAVMSSEHVGTIEIHDLFSTVDLPEGMPRDLFRVLKKVPVMGRKLHISRVEGGSEPDTGKPRHKGGGKKTGTAKKGKKSTSRRS